MFFPKIFTYKKAIFRHMASKSLQQYYQKLNFNTSQLHVKAVLGQKR